MYSFTSIVFFSEKAIQEFESVVMGNQEFQEMYTINGSLKKVI